MTIAVDLGRKATKQTNMGECSSNIAKFVVSATLFVSIINYQ